MKLGDLFKKMYQRDSDIESHKMAGDFYDPSKQKKEKESEGIEEAKKIEDKIIEEQTGSEISDEEVKKRRKRLFVFGVIATAVLVGIIGVIIVYFKFIGSAFVEEKVVVEIQGPEQVRNTERSTYTVKVSNANRIAIQNVEYRLSYPESMVIEETDFIQKQGFNNSKIDVGVIPAGGSKQYEVSFRSFGPRDRRVFLNFSAIYRPKNFNSDFEKNTQKSVVIKSSPITLTALPTKEAASGEQVNVDFIVKNEGKETYKDLELRLSYPDGFNFQGSSPQPDYDKNIWSVSSLAPDEQVKVSVSGYLEGVEESLKRFYGEIGESRGGDDFLMYTENEGIIQIVPSRVQIIIDPSSDAVYPGSTVNYKITFKNTSDVALRDLILYQHIDSRLIIKETVDVNDGYYDSENDVLFWKASDIPALKNLQPGEQGFVFSTIDLYEDVPMNNENDTNFTLSSFAEIESLDVDSPIWENKKIASPEKITKVHSKMILGIEASFEDSQFPNSGPVPMVVEEKTTLTVRFTVMNTSNVLKNMILKTSLPSGITWEDVYVPDNAGVEVNTRSNELKWIIGTVDVGTGFIEPAKTLSFKIGVKPSANQVGTGSFLDILNSLTVTALDDFTGQEVSYFFRGMGISKVEDIPNKILSKEEAKLIKEQEEAKQEE